MIITPAGLESRVEDDLFGVSIEELEGYPIGVITLDRTGCVLRYNRAEESLARRKARDVIGQNFFRDVAPCTAVREFAGRFEAFAVGRDSAAERFAFTFAFAWGTQDVTITLVRRRDYEEILVVVGVRSMRRPLVRTTVDPRRRQLVRPSEPTTNMAYYREAVDGSVQWSDGLYDLLEVDPGERSTANEPYLSYVAASDADAVRAAFAAHDDGGVSAGVDHNVTTARGNHRTFRLFPHIELPDRSVLHAVVDITDQRKNTQQWWSAAHVDELTGLPNRKQFVSHVDSAIQRETPFALIFIDLDRFKLINDTAGHDVGDQLLRLTASRLTGSLREGDVIARLNGDEFVAMIADVTGEDAENIAQQILDSVSRPFVIDDVDYRISLSVGIAMYPRDGADTDSMLQAADIAMYQSKQNAPNGYQVFDAEIRDSIRSAALRQNDLRRAMDSEEFELVFQPIFSIDGALCAAEALVRWNHPTVGLIMPNDFIPLAEKSGLIAPLGGLILRTACRQMRAWLDRGAAIARISVNISPSQFNSPTFARDVAAILAETGVPSECLELELTESVIVDDFDRAIATIAALKVLGVRLSIDDFGTGYSSLSYLKHLPVDALKLDRSFVIGLGDRSVDDAIASTVVNLATILRLDVIAEGVEKREQLDALVAMGCSHVQGFFLSRPLSVAAFDKYLAAQSSVSTARR